MTIRDEFAFEVLDLATTKGLEPAAVYRRGEFAVHEVLGEHKRVEIIHIPSRTAFPAAFSDTMQAMQAAKAIAQLRPDWVAFDVRSITPELRRAVRGIVERHHGAWFPNAQLSRATDPLYTAAMAAAASKH